MTRKWLVAMLGSAALVFSAAAVAQKPPAPVQGFYAGADFGSFDTDINDSDDTAIKILGGYQINRTFAAELSYGMLFDKGGVEINAWELVGIASLPLGNKFSLFGKLGFAMWDLGGNTSDDGADLTYGVGVQYDLTPKLGIRGQWQRYDIREDADLLSVGVIFRF